MVRDGWGIVIPLLGIAVFCMVLTRWVPSGAWAPAAGVSGVLAVMIGFFFRDPRRTIPEGEGLVLSAADGRIVAIRRLEHEAFLGGPAVQISVFLSILDVHVNRMPLTGIIRVRRFVKGRYRLAHKDTASQNNQQMVLGIESDHGRVVVKQIVGFVARRIVCDVQEGDQVHAGQKFGLIRFGSRVDVIVSAHATIKVKTGDRVKGGETILGVMPSATDE